MTTAIPDNVTCFDVFNGDADGICALHQLRLAFPREATEITGVKRDVALLSRIDAKAGDRITVLDVSLDTNVEALKKHLAAGAEVEYFDHHAANQRFAHPNLQLYWNDARDVCTSLLVNEYLEGRYVMWAIVAAFGDNLLDTANGLAMQHGLSREDRSALMELGRLLNYNAYGESTQDLHVHPQLLYREVHKFVNPFDFIHNSSHFLALQYAFAEETIFLSELQPVASRGLSEIYLLPDVPWARRLSGLLANRLLEERREYSFAVLTPRQQGGFVVSVRSAHPEALPADRLCSQFAGGGGRRIAAGINVLEVEQQDLFYQRFFDFFEPAQAGHQP